MDSNPKSLPFGIAQIGKAFRNEITPRNFIFRVREFEQMELEFFVKNGDDEKWHEYWLEERLSWWEDKEFLDQVLKFWMYLRMSSLIIQKKHMILCISFHMELKN